MATCDRCGATSEDPGVLLGWSSAVERGRLQRYCVACSRENVRAMEGKLDSEYW